MVLHRCRSLAVPLSRESFPLWSATHCPRLAAAGRGWAAVLETGLVLGRNRAANRAPCLDTVVLSLLRVPPAALLPLHCSVQAPCGAGHGQKLPPLPSTKPLPQLYFGGHWWALAPAWGCPGRGHVSVVIVGHSGDGSVRSSSPLSWGLRPMCAHPGS